MQTINTMLADEIKKQIAQIQGLHISLKDDSPIGDVDLHETYCSSSLRLIYMEASDVATVAKPPRLIIERDNEGLDEFLDEGLDDIVKVWCDSRKYRLGNADCHDFSVEVIRYLERELGDQPQWVELASGDEGELEDNLLYYHSVDFSDPVETQEFFDAANELLPDSIQLSDAFAALKPVYIYDHGGVRIQSTPFSCPWDSGQIGYAWISWDDAYEHFDLGPHRRRITKDVGSTKVRYALDASDVDHEVANCDETVTLDSEIDNTLQVLDDCLTGNVWGYSVLEYCEESEDFEIMDSCHGFLGDPENSGCIEDGWESYVMAAGEWLNQVKVALSNRVQLLEHPATYSPVEFVRAVLEADNFVEAHHLVDQLRSGQVRLRQ